MVRSGDVCSTAPVIPIGYSLRHYVEADRASYWRLFTEVYGSSSRLDDLRTAALPNGFFVIEHEPSRDVVASTAAAEYERVGHPEPGSLQWVMTHPDHTGKGLGTAVVAAATDRLTKAGYGRIYLSTDDWRLPAISIYLKLGWKPLLFAPDMKTRWLAVFGELGKQSVEEEFVVEPR